MSALAFAYLLGLSIQTKYAVPLQVSIRTDTPLVPMFHQEKAYLVYELELVNYDPHPANLTKITVRNGSGKTLATFMGDDLKKCLSSQGAAPGADPTTLEHGKLSVANIWIALPPNAIPREISHTLSFKRDDSGPTTVSGGKLLLSARRGVIVQPPLTGTNWIAATAPSNTSAHRTARMCLEGHASIGQRFAIDWLKVDGHGNTFNGPESKNESYFAYGKNILACANAKVVKVVDGLRENVPHGGVVAVVITPRSLPGNHVILDLGHGIYAAYAHMIPGSIRVKPGQRVKAGQVLGKLGNSGNSAEPHLHFQIMNAPDFIASEGLPFGCPMITIQPTKASEDGTAIIFQKVGARTTIRNQMPLENDWVAFPK